MLVVRVMSLSLKIVSYRVVNYLDVKLAAFCKNAVVLCEGFSSWHFLGFISAARLMTILPEQRFPKCASRIPRDP